MGFNLYLDIAALTILFFLIISIILKRQLIGTSNKVYLVVIICAFIATVLDIAASLAEIPIPVLFVLNTFFVLFRAATALALFFYACNLGKIYYRLKRKRWGYNVLMIPFLILAVFLIINFFNKCVFDYLEGPKYVRGPFMTVAYIVSYLYLIGALFVIFYSRKYHSTAQIIAIITVFLLQVGASIFQFFVGDILIEMFVAAITLLTLSIFIESPENFIDYKTRSLGFRPFAVNIERQLDLKDSFNVLFMHIENVSAIYNLYPHDKAIEFFRACNAYMSERARKIDHTLTVYFLGDATFAYVFYDRNKEEEMQRFVTTEFSKTMTHNGISYLYESKFCSVRCPEDCRDVTTLIGFSTTFFKLTEAKTLDLDRFRLPVGNLLFELDHILERAIHEESFSMHYQGIYSLSERRFIAAEGLLRLTDPVFGMIMPSLMIPYAESSGKISAISHIVMKKCFAFYAEKLRGKLDYIEINLAPAQLLDVNLPNKIADLAKEYGIQPHEIVFEVTETVAAKEDLAMENNIKALRDQGYRIAIDDFGTGYSNLSRIMMLDVSIIKFDKSMTDLLAHDDQDEFFLGLLPFIRHRNMTVLFEGVETKEVVDKLIRMKADHIQGYYFSKPINGEGFLELLKKQADANS